VGSGGLYNNKKHAKDPLVTADNPIGEWNHFDIKIVGDRVTVYLNGKLVVDDTVLENYWEPGQPLPVAGSIELQHHGDHLEFRNIFIRELAKAEDIGKVAEAVAKVKAATQPIKPRKVLAFTRPAGFVHSSINLGAEAFKMMGEKTGAWQTTISDDLSYFEAEKLAEFDAVLLCSITGDWIKPTARDAEKLKFDPKDQKAVEAVQQRLQKNLLDYVSSGHGLAGFHSSSDANYKWAEYGQMIGGYFAGHPWHEKVGVKLNEPSHTLLAAFGGKDFEITDEIYQFREPYSREHLRVLLSLDTGKINMTKKGINRKDGDFAVAWVHPWGKGRVFYSSLGHREEIFWNEQVLQFYSDGLQYALGDLKADDKPISKTTGALGVSDRLCAAGEPGKTITLFDGNNLDAWDFKKDGWKIDADGSMTVNKDGGYIWTKEKFEDFVLELDYKMSKDCNSGVFVRSDPKNPVMGGFEIQIFDSAGKQKPSVHDNGALYDALAPSSNPTKPAGEWNHYKITCKGPMIIVELNGVKIVEANIDQWTEPNKNPDGTKNKFKSALKDLPRNNHIGLQYHGHPVWFKDVKVTPTPRKD
jgi:hypothetical protein